MKNRNDEEIFIFGRMVEEDAEAFRFFFEKYYTDLCNFINLYLNDSVAAEDVVQDVYVVLWKKKKEIHIETSVKSYLLKASRNKSLNYLRDEKVRLNILARLGKEAEASSENFEDALENSQLETIIEKAVKSLPEKCREIYLLSRDQKLTYKEIADKLGISIKTVENQMGNALKKLRELLMPYYEDMLIFFLIFLLS